MRRPVQPEKLERFMAELGRRVKGAGRIYFTGGATALSYGWRSMTVDVDLKADPEPRGLFEAIAKIKDDLEINVELASPSDFIPELPGWRERSPFIVRHGMVDFHHYDPYSQALSKLLRGHERDLSDVEAMVKAGLVSKPRLFDLFSEIESELIRYPAIDAESFGAAVEDFCKE
jgi:hypothetical protein